MKLHVRPLARALSLSRSWALPAALAAVLVACGKHDDAAAPETEEGHTHDPMMEGNALVELGDHEANLEIQFEAAKGELTLYLVDGHATKYVRSTQESLAVTVEPEEGEAFSLSLTQVASTLSGEKVGDSSTYRIQDDRLKGLDHLHGKVASIAMLGTSYTDVEFAWPAGEDDHEH